MRIAGRLAAEVLDFVTPHVKPGVTTDRLDELCHDFMVNVQKTTPAPLNYAPPGHRPYPKSICTSVNHQVCHGVPGEKVLKNGDIVNIDITVIKDGWHGDTSRMFLVGEPSIQARRLAETTYECMWMGIAQVRPGASLGDIGHAIQRHAEAHGYSVVREFCGHGIGKRFHEEPQVLHYGQPGPGHAPGGRHDLHHRAHDQRRAARHPQPRRRLDHRHRRPLALRAVGAHRPGDRVRASRSSPFPQAPPPRRPSWKPRAPLPWRPERAAAGRSRCRAKT